MNNMLIIIIASSLIAANSIRGCKAPTKADATEADSTAVNPRVNGTVADTCNPMPECVDPKPRAPK